MSPSPSFIKKAFVATIATVAIAAAIQAIFRPDLNAFFSAGNWKTGSSSTQEDLVGAIFSGRLDRIAFLFPRTTDLNAYGSTSDTKGYTPLAAAVLTKNLPLVRFLLNLTVDPKKEFCIKPNLCTTPLIIAYQNRKPETWERDLAIMQELLAHKAGPFTKDSNGVSLFESWLADVQFWIAEKLNLPIAGKK